MNRLLWRWMWLLVCCALAACATTPSSWTEIADDDDVGEVVSFEEACAEDSSLLALCSGERCGLYRCQEVMEQAGAGHVVLARGGALVLPGPTAEAQRYWGSAQELPEDSRPVFIIPWNTHRPELLPSQKQMLEEQAAERNQPHERHHIFPQAFRVWFTRQGIDIDEYVIPLLVEKHRSIHRGMNGGPWNEAWRKFIQTRQNQRVPKEEIYRYAGQLIYEFELFGPVVPYWKQPPPLPQGY